MDDSLEQPTAQLSSQEFDEKEDAGSSSGEEDGGLDWTKLPSGSSTKPFIPKRGEKEYEPTGESGAGTLLQEHKLDRMRNAMFTAIDVERTVSNKVVSFAIWDPSISRALVTIAHGNHFVSMGHSVPGKVLAENLKVESREKKVHSQLQLLPEEAIYLIERGSMFCRKSLNVQYPLDSDAFDHAVPMTVQEAYAEMIGKEDVTLEHYQVYSYLKRLGYVVTRARPPSSFYPVAARHLPKLLSSSPSLIRRLVSIVTYPFRIMFKRKIDWWKPLKLRGIPYSYSSYSSMFSSLRIFPSGYRLPLHHHVETSSPSPYSIFYNLYKPGTPFSKKNPRPPDYSIVVVNGRTTFMPTIHELSDLYNELPELPPPVPRRRQTQNPVGAPSGEKRGGKQPSVSADNTPPAGLSLRIRSLWNWILWKVGKAPLVATKETRKPNPFQILKNGKKLVIVAVVDAGMISFYRFGQGVLDEWPMA